MNSEKLNINMKKKQPVSGVWNKTWSNREIYFGLMEEQIFRNMNRWINFHNKTILELGSGTGKLSFLALTKGNAKKVTLIDFSDKAMEIAHNLFKDYSASVDFILADIFNLNLKKHFDIVFSSGLVEHFSGQRQIGIINIHQKYSRDIVFTIVPASPHYNNIRCRYIKNINKYGWEKPISLKQMRQLFVKNQLKILTNRRFYPLYGFSFPGVDLVNDILSPVENLVGGLLITVGKK